MLDNPAFGPLRIFGIPCSTRHVTHYSEHMMCPSNFNIPAGLAKIANGRDLIGTSEVSQVVNVSPKTILKHLHLNGHFYGILPIKIGKSWQFPIQEIAKLIQFGSLNNKAK